MLEINVVGSVGTGKTAIAMLVKDALQAAGINAVLTGEDVHYATGDYHKRINTVAERQTAPLKINEIQEPRRNSEEL